MNQYQKEKVRVFIGFFLPDEIKKEVLEIQRKIPSFKGKLVEENNLHLTLKFLGEISEEELNEIKNILKTCGFSEIYSYSLVSENDLLGLNINPEKTLRVDNPVSREFEYLRPTLKINLIKAIIANKPNFEEINLFELGKVYSGEYKN